MTRPTVRTRPGDATRRTSRLGPPAVFAAIAVAWTLALVSTGMGGAHAVHGGLHSGGITGESSAPWAGLGLFLLAWQAMIAAMMLPSSLPFIRHFARASSAQPRAGLAFTAFVGGYVAVWTVFGALAFGADVALHAAVAQLPWLDARPWIVAGAVLALAGGFQFSDLKTACLRQCRSPASYLLRHYRRGVDEAFKIGSMHGLSCLGCCWALMLVGLVAGVATLTWMAILTLVMVLEKTTSIGAAATKPLGFGLLGMGALVLAYPGAAAILGFNFR